MNELWKCCNVKYFHQSSKLLKYNQFNLIAAFSPQTILYIHIFHYVIIVIYSLLKGFFCILSIIFIYIIIKRLPYMSKSQGDFLNNYSLYIVNMCLYCVKALCIISQVFSCALFHLFFQDKVNPINPSPWSLYFYSPKSRVKPHFLFKVTSRKGTQVIKLLDIHWGPLSILPIRSASNFVTYVHNKTPIFRSVVLTCGFFY